VSEPAELFARLTCEIEDMHGLAIEGQRPDQPSEIIDALVLSIRLRLTQCGRITAQITDANGL
jgi:hypothetical protein